MSSLPRISVLGLGYIGLPTASLLATKGFQVSGMDVNQQIVESLNKGRVLIQEPSLDIMVKSAVNSGQLKAFLEPQEADIFIIAVPTPFKDGHEPDLSYIEQASKALAPKLVPGNLVILESTSPVGTTEMVAEIIEKQRPDLDVAKRCMTSQACSASPIYVAHCPERVLPGQILRELVENDRVVGGIDPASTEKAREFYKMFVSGKVLTTDSRTAEMAKLTENAYRDVNIAFANELSLICDQMDINVWELIELANRHPRVNILHPGPGVGGHCIAVDPWFIVHANPELSKLMRTAREINNYKPDYVLGKILSKSQRFKKPVIACLGLSYKADVDDLRESPAIKIVQDLSGHNQSDILVVEPNIKELPSGFNSSIRLAALDEALNSADILVALVAHKEFKELSQAALKDKIVLDFVNVFG
jgi:UDP-N-acetyl-D-mannosaminuronic acid dehydrogenase